MIRFYRNQVEMEFIIFKSLYQRMAGRMTKRLQKEFEAIQKTNLDLKASLPTEDLKHWNINFNGAKGTLYEG